MLDQEDLLLRWFRAQFSHVRLQLHSILGINLCQLPSFFSRLISTSLDGCLVVTCSTHVYFKHVLQMIFLLNL